MGMLNSDQFIDAFLWVSITLLVSKCEVIDEKQLKLPTNSHANDIFIHMAAM